MQTNFKLIQNNAISIDGGVSGESKLNIDPDHLIWQIVYRLKLEEWGYKIQKRATKSDYPVIFYWTIQFSFKNFQSRISRKFDIGIRPKFILSLFMMSFIEIAW